MWYTDKQPLLRMNQLQVTGKASVCFRDTRSHGPVAHMRVRGRLCGRHKVQYSRAVCGRAEVDLRYPERTI